jgi:hypothetical protein
MQAAAPAPVAACSAARAMLAPVAAGAVFTPVGPGRIIVAPRARFVGATVGPGFRCLAVRPATPTLAVTSTVGTSLAPMGLGVGNRSWFRDGLSRFRRTCGRDFFTQPRKDFLQHDNISAQASANRRGLQTFK